MRQRLKRSDRQLREFGQKDLGVDIARSGAGVVVRPRSRQMPTSILLAPALVAKLRQKADRRGIGYQTMLKIIVAEHVDDY